MKLSRREVLACSSGLVAMATAGVPETAIAAEPSGPVGRRKLKVVVVGAHPDDPETGCGGRAHIAYWAGGERHLLLYAFRHGSRWEIRGVDTGVYVGSSKTILLIRDAPHIIYTDGGELKHAWRENKSWKKEVIDDESFWTGGSPQAVADERGNIHVVYLERKGGRAWAKVKYAVGTTGLWKTETVTESPEPNYRNVLFSKMVQYRNPSICAGRDVGSNTSMAIAPDGTVHFACYDREKHSLIYRVADSRGVEAPPKPQVSGVAPNPQGDTVIDKDTIWRGLDLTLDGDLIVKNAKLVITCSTLRFTSGHGILCRGDGPLRNGIMPGCDGEIHIRNNSPITPAQPDGYTGLGFAGRALQISDSTLQRMRTLRTEWGFNYRAGIALHNPGRFFMENSLYRECPGPQPPSRGAFRGIYMGRSHHTSVEMRNNILYNLGRVQAVYARKVRYLGNVITSDKPVPPHSLTPCYVADGLYAYNYIGEHQDHGGFNLTLGSSHLLFRHNEQGLYSSYIFDYVNSDLWVEDDRSTHSGGFAHRAGGVGSAGVVFRNCHAAEMRRARLDASFNTCGVLAEGLSGTGVHVVLDGAPDGWMVKDVACPVDVQLYPQRDFTGQRGKLSPRCAALIGLKGGQVSLASCASNISLIDLDMETVVYQGRNAKKAVRFINLSPDAKTVFKDREQPHRFYGYPEDYTGWSLADEHTPYWYVQIVVVDPTGRPVPGAEVTVANEVSAQYGSINRKGQERAEFVTGPNGATSLPGNWPYRWEETKASSDYFRLAAGQQIELGGWMKLYASRVAKYVKGWIILEECDEDKGVVAEHRLPLKMASSVTNCAGASSARTMPMSSAWRTTC